MSTIPGININKINHCLYCSVEDFSNEIKELIRIQLSNVWNGFAEVENLPDIHSYKRTLNSFLDRYRSKSESTRKGMIGELLAHILINNTLTDFTSLSVLKNKEERSIKKGFDIIYHEESTLKIWYSEVKSGRRESGTETSSEYNTILLDRSNSSIVEMFLEKRASLWESALIDVTLTIKDSKGKIKLAELLDKDSPVHKRDDKKNVILISVLYHCPTEPIEMSTIVAFYDKIESIGNFSEIIVFSIQKKLFEKVADFLEAEAVN